MGTYYIGRSGVKHPTYGAVFDVNEVRQANREAGYYFFEPDTMRFFRSRVAPGVIAGRFFITSEQQDWNTPRCYTVREFMPDGSLEEPGEFMEHATLARARTAAKNAAKARHSYYFANAAKGKNARTYVVHDVIDPWEALDRLPRGFTIGNCGRARDYMTPDKGYVVR